MKKALRKALNDTLAMAVKRFKTTYKNIEDKLLTNLKDDFVDFSTNACITTCEDFDKKLEKLTKRYKDVMQNSKRQEFAEFGFTQKFLSMSFKYMYCFENSKR